MRLVSWLGLALLLTTGASGLPAFAAAAPDAVQKAAAMYQADTRGFVAYEARAHMAIQAPMLTRSVAWHAWVVTEGGASAHTRVLALSTNGQAATAAELKAHEAKLNEPKPGGRSAFDLPCEPRHLASYAFTPEAGGRRFAFRATLRDARHGDGTLSLGADGRMRSLAITPCQLPERVSSGAFTLEGAPLAGGWWGLTRFWTRYAGGVGPMKGSMTMTQTHSGHRRFPTEAAAKAAGPR